MAVRDLVIGGLLDGVGFDLGAGECLVILDEHDARRTALLQVLAGARRPDAGTVHAPPAAAVWHADGLPEQAPVEQSVRDLLGCAPEQARALLAGLGLAHRATHEPWAMSAGERRRIAVEVALSGPAALVVLDEPERGLDKQSLRWLAARVRAVVDAGRTVVVATYNEWLADAVGDIVVEEL
ncbi:ABC transporter ATP-binding protein [Cumulibacter manganitolerans]|uniref:ABC transporter ATP-binding protein n=1 Tax=Cumulibacter manganitolerans TaxID=1884992 RepID=UPI001885DBFF|nr:ATP-binding cassette domain-containing protein [Cumulibacter manganitolerans]